MKRSQVVPSMKRSRLYHQCESEKYTLLNGSADFSFERCGLSFDTPNLMNLSRVSNPPKPVKRRHKS